MHHIVRQKILNMLDMDPKEGVAVSIPHAVHLLTRTFGRRNCRKGVPLVPWKEMTKDRGNLRRLMRGTYDEDFINSVVKEIYDLNTKKDIRSWATVTP